MATATKITTRTTPTAKKGTAVTTAAKKKTATRKATAAKPATSKAAPTTPATTPPATRTAQTVADRAATALKSIDFSAFDLDALKKLDPRNIDWSKMDLPEVDGRKLLDAVRDAAYVTVGLGVLAVQKANVARGELATRIADRFGADSGQIEELISSFESRIVSFDDAIQNRVDETVAKVGERLPAPAASLLNQAHSVAKTARTQVRSMVLRAS